MDNNNNANVLNMTYEKYPFKVKLKNMTTNVNKGVLVITPQETHTSQQLKIEVKVKKGDGYEISHFLPDFQ